MTTKPNKLRTWARLGTLSRDTKGDGGPHWEASGLQRSAGLSRD